MKRASQPHKISALRQQELLDQLTNSDSLDEQVALLAELSQPSQHGYDKYIALAHFYSTTPRLSPALVESACAHPNTTGHGFASVLLGNPHLTRALAEPIYDRVRPTLPRHDPTNPSANNDKYGNGHGLWSLLISRFATTPQDPWLKEIYQHFQAAQTPVDKHIVVEEILEFPALPLSIYRALGQYFTKAEQRSRALANWLKRPEANPALVSSFSLRIPQSVMYPTMHVLISELWMKPPTHPDHQVWSRLPVSHLVQGFVGQYTFYGSQYPGWGGPLDRLSYALTQLPASDRPIFVSLIANTPHGPDILMDWLKDMSPAKQPILAEIHPTLSPLIFPYLRQLLTNSPSREKRLAAIAAISQLRLAAPLAPEPEELVKAASSDHKSRVIAR